jgi:hypothetical protein
MFCRFQLPDEQTACFVNDLLGSLKTADRFRDGSRVLLGFLIRLFTAEDSLKVKEHPNSAGNARATSDKIGGISHERRDVPPTPAFLREKTAYGPRAIHLRAGGSKTLS